MDISESEIKKTERISFCTGKVNEGFMFLFKGYCKSEDKLLQNSGRKPGRLYLNFRGKNV